MKPLTKIVLTLIAAIFIVALVAHNIQPAMSAR